MNAPRPTLTSSTSAPIPSAIFLLRIDAQMSGMLSTVPVTSRSAYSFRSAGAISSVWPISTHPVFFRTRAHLVERRAACEIRESLRVCRACRRCGRARGPTSSAPSRRTRPRAARARARACRRRRRSSACRPGCRRTRRDRGARPDRTIASVSVDGFVERHAAQHDGHEQRGDLVVGPRAVRRARDERADRVAVERAAIAFLANDIDRPHGGASIVGIRDGDGPRAARGCGVGRCRTRRRLRWRRRAHRSGRTAAAHRRAAAFASGWRWCWPPSAAHGSAPRQPGRHGRSAPWKSRWRSPRSCSPRGRCTVRHARASCSCRAAFVVHALIDIAHRPGWLADGPRATLVHRRLRGR